MSEPCPHAAAQRCLGLAMTVRTHATSPDWWQPDALARHCEQLLIAYEAARFGEARLSRMLRGEVYRLAGRDYRTAHQAVVAYAGRVIEAIREGAGEVYTDVPTPETRRGRKIVPRISDRPEYGPLGGLVTDRRVWDAARPLVVAIEALSDVMSISAHLDAEWDRLSMAGVPAKAKGVKSNKAPVKKPSLERRQAIRDVLVEAGERLQGRQIKEKLRVKSYESVRHALAWMRSNGLLSNTSAGYWPADLPDPV